MEHSYSRDFRPPMDTGLTNSTRALMVHRPPQCPSCHTHSHDERIDLEESYNPPIPSYNEENAKIAMMESENVARKVRNLNSEDYDWEEKINKIGWSVQQIRLFSKITKLLDMDRLARLTIADKQHEPVHRRMVIDKSVGRLRQALASVSWDPRLTQWIHGLLVESLPPSYLAAYIDILQTLKAKLPNLVDKMIFGRPVNISQELIGPILKKPWEPIVAHKNRKLPGQPYIVVVPSGPNVTSPSSRVQKWYSLFATMASVIPIIMPPHGNAVLKQSIQNVSEQMVAVTRSKIQEVRQEAPNRPIILVGFNTGAALAVQIGLVEAVSCIVCLGFAFNTVNGTRGAPDDHITDITAPVLFVIGQMSARSSQEEIEFLRERMVAQTSLVVVGSADDCLRVCKSKRKIEGVTQSMVDNMVMDEIAEFATNCLLNSPRPKQTIKDPNGQKANLLLSNNSSNLAATGGPPPIAAVPGAREVPSTASVTTSAYNRKRKMSLSADAVHDSTKNARSNKQQNTPAQRKTPKSQKTPRADKMLLNQNQQALDAAIQSILPATTPTPVGKKPAPTVTNYQITGGNNIEIRQSTGSQVMTGLASSPLVLPLIKRELPNPSQSSMAATTADIKVIPANQFIQLKPSGSTQKFVTLKSSPKPVVSVIPKPPGMSSTSAPSPLMRQPSPHTTITQHQSFSPTKFTIVRSSGAISGPSTPIASVSPMKTIKSPPTPDLSNTNIFDIPIVFADNDGNIQDGSPQKSTDVVPKTTPSIITIGPAITNTSVMKTESMNRLITLQPSMKPNKVVVINKSNMKQVPANVLSSTALNKSTSIPSSALKFAKVVISNPLSKASTSTTSTPGMVPKILGQILPNQKIEILNNTVVKSATGGPPTPSHQRFQPVIINVDPSKTTTMKNFVRVGETQIRPITSTNVTMPTKVASVTGSSSAQLTPGVPGTNTIFIKTNSLAQFANRKPAILNRNITVRKVNIMPQSVSTASPMTPSTTVVMSSAPKTITSGTIVQQKPKTQ